MRLIISASLAILICLTLAGSPALAAQKNPDINRQELSNFDRFLDGHPSIEKDLRKDPSLINNSSYVSSHPELKEFLGNHPGVREEIKETPRYFMNRETRFDKSGRDINRREVGSLDEFLDKHPAIEKDLQKDPSLIKNGDYLAKHPDLNTYLNNHPRVKQEAGENPRIFMKRERKFDRHEDRKGERREEGREERREERREKKGPR